MRTAIPLSEPKYSTLPMDDVLGFYGIGIVTQRKTDYNGITTSFEVLNGGEGENKPEQLEWRSVSSGDLSLPLTSFSRPYDVLP